ncbi:hypothetical protein J8I01_07365 [Aeromonas sanarellii]|uniref:Uncharacterized protein n=1 Tax=Aeromonas sanarellii TaxID=633415 RepID=A0ABS4B4C7_9GAMM|nr:hypothetical protein [Aeromonas sanarellii]MBP0602325.1 hypothetical protein [Aeromonas sanarellii]
MNNGVNKGLNIGDILLFMHPDMNGYAFYANGWGCRQYQKYASQYRLSVFETTAGNMIHPGCMVTMSSTKASRRHQSIRAENGIQIYAMKLQRKKEGGCAGSIRSAGRAGQG